MNTLTGSFRRARITRPAATLTRPASRSRASASAGSSPPAQEQHQAQTSSAASSSHSAANPTRRGGDVTALPAPPGQPPSDEPAGATSANGAANGPFTSATGAFTPSNGPANSDPSSTGSAAPSAPQQTLRVGGDGLKLDAMGPLVVNVDGSVGRVGNWAEMTPAEREGTRRLLARRNQERLRALREREESLEGASEGKK